MSKGHEGVQVTLGLLGHVIRCHIAVRNTKNNVSSGHQELHSLHIVLPTVHLFPPKVTQLIPRNLVQILPTQGLCVRRNGFNNQCKPGRWAIRPMASDWCDHDQGQQLPLRKTIMRFNREAQTNRQEEAQGRPGAIHKARSLPQCCLCRD